MNQERIGKFIAERRKNKKLTQEQLADKLNTTSKSISRWENGKTMPDYSIIKSLCDELDISINELLSGEKIQTNNYEHVVNENLDNILREYYKMKKQKNIIKNILIIVAAIFLLFIVRVMMVLGIATLTFLTPAKSIVGIENYNKNYYIKKYGGDLNSNLSIFPDNKQILKDAEFSSTFQTNLFDSDGYILLIAKYEEEEFDNEINRLKKLSITIYDNCNVKADSYTNYVKYDEASYEYPAYITIDGFGHTYEYALVNKDKLEISYIYLSYPKRYNQKYKNYLKKDRSSYSIEYTLDMYSMYNHSFDNGSSFIEYDYCN